MPKLLKGFIAVTSIIGTIVTAILAAIYINENYERFGK